MITNNQQDTDSAINGLKQVDGRIVGHSRSVSVVTVMLSESD